MKSLFSNPGPRLAVLGLAGLLLVLACVTPALVVAREGSDAESWPGIQTLGLGWLALLIGQAAWLANPLAAVAALLLLLRLYRIAAVLAGLALAVGLHTLALFHQEIPANEGSVGPPYVLQRLGPGFYLWMASLLVLFVGPLVLRAIGERPSSDPPTS